jgi:hypothetical protein
LGWTARRLLRTLDDKAVRRALARTQSQKEAPSLAREAPDRDLLTRYRGGEHVAVWDVLRGHDGVAGAPRDEAIAVAQETMRRVLANLELLTERLASRGWCVHDAARQPPSIEDHDAMRELAEVTGAPLPASLVAFWSEIGAVDLSWGGYELPELADADLGTGLGLPELDPLVIFAPSTLVDQRVYDWRNQNARWPPQLQEPYRLGVSPDRWMKNNTSGDAYCIELPYLGVDPIFADDHRLPFVEYLRLCFRWAGFPRLAQQGHEPRSHDFVRQMTVGFVDF